MATIKASESVWVVALATPVVLQGVGVVAGIAGRTDIFVACGCLAGMCIPVGFAVSLWASDILARKGR